MAGAAQHGSGCGNQWADGGRRQRWQGQEGEATTAPSAIAGAAPASGVWDEMGGGDLHFRSFDRGVSVLQPLIGSLVECVVVCVGVCLSISASKYRELIAQRGTSVMLCRVCSEELHANSTHLNRTHALHRLSLSLSDTQGYRLTAAGAVPGDHASATSTAPHHTPTETRHCDL